MVNEMKHIISLGGGVQSTTILLMACHGVLTPKPMCAIFSDTGWERKQTYEMVEYLTEYAKGFGIPVYTVSNGNIRDDAINPDVKAPGIPYFVNTQKVNDSKPKLAMLRRQCTADYKIRPIRAFIKDRLLPDVSHKNPVAKWIGISLDEVTRMKPANVKWIQHQFPLIDKRLRRSDCYSWLTKNGFDIPIKSSCVGCPFHADADWQSLTEDELQDVIDFENKVNEVGLSHPKKGFVDNDLRVHKSHTPIADRPFEKDTNQLDLFGSEDDTCGGGCFL